MESLKSCGVKGGENITVLGFLLSHYGRFEGISLFSLIHAVLLNSIVTIVVHDG